MRQRAPQRRSRAKLLFLLLVLIAAWIAYERCDVGFGLGPGGGGLGWLTGGGGGDEGGGGKAAKSEPGEKSTPDVRPAAGGGAAPRRCNLRLDATGLTLDGRPSALEAAVAACKRAGGADLTVTGDALFGDRERVRAALDGAGVNVFVSEPGTAPDK